MINNSWAEYVFIRICIFALQSIPLVSLAYCFSLAFTSFFTNYEFYRVSRALEVVFLTESFFFLFCFLPYRIWLQQEAIHPPAPSREERAILYQRCSDNITDPEAYLQKWFLGADIRDIRKENVKEFFLWAFFNRGGPPGDDDEELEEYIGVLERQLGREIPEGRGNAKCLRLTLDEVVMSHRSLIWYCVCILMLHVPKIEDANINHHSVSDLLTSLHSVPCVTMASTFTARISNNPLASFLFARTVYLLRIIRLLSTYRIGTDRTLRKPNSQSFSSMASVSVYIPIPNSSTNSMPPPAHPMIILAFLLSK